MNLVINNLYKVCQMPLSGKLGAEEEMLKIARNNLKKYLYGVIKLLLIENSDYQQQLFLLILTKKSLKRGKIGVQSWYQKIEFFERENFITNLFRIGSEEKWPMSLWESTADLIGTLIECEIYIRQNDIENREAKSTTIKDIILNFLPEKIEKNGKNETILKIKIISKLILNIKNLSNYVEIDNLLYSILNILLENYYNEYELIAATESIRETFKILNEKNQLTNQALNMIGHGFLKNLNRTDSYKLIQETLQAIMEIIEVGYDKIINSNFPLWIPSNSNWILFYFNNYFTKEMVEVWRVILENGKPPECIINYNSSIFLIILEKLSIHENDQIDLMDIAKAASSFIELIKDVSSKEDISVYKRELLANYDKLIHSEKWQEEEAALISFGHWCDFGGSEDFEKLHQARAYRIIQIIGSNYNVPIIHDSALWAISKLVCLDYQWVTVFFDPIIELLELLDLSNRNHANHCILIIKNLIDNVKRVNNSNINFYVSKSLSFLWKITQNVQIGYDMVRCFAFYTISHIFDNNLVDLETFYYVFNHYKIIIVEKINQRNTLKFGNFGEHQITEYIEDSFNFFYDIIAKRLDDKSLLTLDLFDLTFNAAISDELCNCSGIYPLLGLFLKSSQFSISEYQLNILEETIMTKILLNISGVNYNLLEAIIFIEKTFSYRIENQYSIKNFQNIIIAMLQTTSQVINDFSSLDAIVTIVPLIFSRANFYNSNDNSSSIIQTTKYVKSFNIFFNSITQSSKNILPDEILQYIKLLLYSFKFAPTVISFFPDDDLFICIFNFLSNSLKYINENVNYLINQKKIEIVHIFSFLDLFLDLINQKNAKKNISPPIPLFKIAVVLKIAKELYNNLKSHRQNYSFLDKIHGFL